MNNIMIFEGQQVEVFEWNGQVLFNPYHVGSCLELAESSVRNYLAAMNEKQAILLKNSDVRNSDIRKLNNAGEKFLTESGVFKLIFKSHKPDAEKFQDWVTDEVLPSIRKHGAYMTAETLEQAILNPDAMIKILTSLKEEKEKRQQLELINKQQFQIIGELKPKADYTDRILQNKSLVNANQIAKDYGMSAKTFNKRLHELGVQYFEGGQWLLYSKYQCKGYTSSETFDFNHANGTRDVKMRTKWTQKGRLFLYELLKKNGIFPLIEQAEDKAS